MNKSQSSEVQTSRGDKIKSAHKAMGTQRMMTLSLGQGAGREKFTEYMSWNFRTDKVGSDIKGEQCAEAWRHEALQ